MEITVCTQNKDKVKEITNYLKDSKITFKTLPPDFNFEVVEDEPNFILNAKKKALSYSKYLKKAVLTDDSGLVVESLNGAPGIHSKRYSGGDSRMNNHKVVNELKGAENRKAYFITVLCVSFPNGKTFYYKGKWHGRIAYRVPSYDGFGYDPIFIPNGKKVSVTKLGFNYKMKHSHRALALKKLVENIDEIINYGRHSR